MDVTDDEQVQDIEVARIVGASLFTVRGWRPAGLGPPWYREGHRIWYPRDGVAAWQATRGRNTPPAAA